MKTIRCFFAAMALVATLLSGLILQGMGLGSLANAASSRHVSSSFVVGQLTKSEAYKPAWPCPGAGSDC